MAVRLWEVVAVVEVDYPMYFSASLSLSLFE